MSTLNNVLRKMDEHYGLKSSDERRIPYSREEHRMFMLNGPRYTDTRTLDKYWEIFGTMGVLIVYQGKPHIDVPKVRRLLGFEE